MIELSAELRKHFKGPGAFDEILNLDGKVYRHHKNRRTIRFEMDGRGYFVKIHGRVGWGEVLKNVLSLKWPVLSARSEYSAIRKLEALRIDTMEIAGFGERGMPPVWLESFVITEEIADTVSLETFCKDWRKEPPDFQIKALLIRKVADIARTLHQSGLNHRDFYICHFLLDRSRPPSPSTKIYLIDLHRVQIRRSTPERWIIKDLSGLFFSAMDAGLTTRDLFRFMKVYAGKPLRSILKDDMAFWQRVRSRAIRLYEKEFGRPPLPFQ